jgi:hypothetical protein
MALVDNTSSLARMTDESRDHRHGRTDGALRAAIFGSIGEPRCARCWELFTDVVDAYMEQHGAAQTVEELVLLECRAHAMARDEMTQDG